MVMIKVAEPMGSGLWCHRNECLQFMDEGGVFFDDGQKHIRVPSAERTRDFPFLDVSVEKSSGRRSKHPLALTFFVEYLLLNKTGLDLEFSELDVHFRRKTECTEEACLDKRDRWHLFSMNKTAKVTSNRMAIAIKDKKLNDWSDPFALYPGHFGATFLLSGVRRRCTCCQSNAFQCLLKTFFERS